MMKPLSNRFSSNSGFLRRCARWLDKIRFQLMVSEDTLVRTEFGDEMYVNPVDFGPSRVISRGGRYEPALTDIMTELLEPGMSVVDVGAQIGYYTLLAARNVGMEGEVISFEPMPENHRILCRNVDLNRYGDRVRIINKAVSSENGTVDLVVKQRNRGGHSIVKRKKNDQDAISTIKVEMTTLDLALDSEPDLVKVDVEGAEAQVLDGMSSTLKSKPIVIFECNHHEWDCVSSSVFEFVDEQGYDLFLISEKGPQEIDVSDIPAIEQGANILAK